MPRDVNLVLDAGQTVTADGQTAAVNTEGGFLAWATLAIGNASGASTTLDARVQFSINGGANYFMAGKFQRLGPNDDNSEMRIPVYIPRPAAGQAYTKVRMDYDVSGASPSYTVIRALLEPMLSLAVQAIDEELGIGAAIKIASA